MMGIVGLVAVSLGIAVAVAAVVSAICNPELDYPWDDWSDDDDN